MKHEPWGDNEKYEDALKDLLYHLPFPDDTVRAILRTLWEEAEARGAEKERLLIHNWMIDYHKKNNPITTNL